MGKLQTIDEFAARLLMVCLFLPERLQVLVVIGACVYFVFRTIATKQLPSSSNYLWALVIGCFYLLFAMAIPLTNAVYKPELMRLCERQVSLLLIPFAFATIAPSFAVLIKEQLIYFVYACFISSMLGNVDYLYHHFFKAGTVKAFSHVDYRNVIENFTGIHPTYMGMYLCFSICILLFAPTFHKRATVLKYTLIYVLLFLFLSLVAKSPIIALAIIAAHYAFINRKTLYKYKLPIAGTLVSIAIACFVVPFISQRIKEIFSYFGFGQPTSTVNNSVYVRKLIWDVDALLIKKNWLTGVGPGRMIHLLQEHYFFYSITNNFFVGYFDPHNEYFSAWLSFGISGLLLFVAILIIHFIKAIRSKNYLYLYLMIILATTFFTETVLSRQQGVLLYAVFTSFFFFRKQLSNARA